MNNSQWCVEQGPNRGQTQNPQNLLQTCQARIPFMGAATMLSVRKLNKKNKLYISRYPWNNPLNPSACGGICCLRKDFDFRVKRSWWCERSKGWSFHWTRDVSFQDAKNKQLSTSAWAIFGWLELGALLTPGPIGRFIGYAVRTLAEQFYMSSYVNLFW